MKLFWGRKRRAARREEEGIRRAEQVAAEGLAALVAARESGELDDQALTEANALIDEGLTLHRKAAIHRRHMDAMAEARAALKSGDEGRMARAAESLAKANQELGDLIEEPVPPVGEAG